MLSRFYSTHLKVPYWKCWKKHDCDQSYIWTCVCLCSVPNWEDEDTEIQPPPSWRRLFRQWQPSFLRQGCPNSFSIKLYKPTSYFHSSITIHFFPSFHACFIFTSPFCLTFSFHPLHLFFFLHRLCSHFAPSLIVSLPQHWYSWPPLVMSTDSAQR